MKKKITLLAVIIGLTVSLLACGGKTNDDVGANQTQAVMSWQDQYDLGIRLLNEGNYEDAILAFTAAINIDPKNVDAYLGLADVYMQCGASEQAMAILQDGMRYGDDSQKIRDKALNLGFGIDENGQIYDASEEEAIAESLAALLIQDQIEYYLNRDSQQYEWLFDDNIMLFGQDVTTISLEQLESIAHQQGWVRRQLEQYYLEDAECTYLGERDRGLIDAQLLDEARVAGLGFSSLDVGYSTTNYQYSDNTAQLQLQHGAETGLLDLKFGDSLETVLIKMGIPNAETVAALAQKWPDEGSDPGRYAQFSRFSEAGYDVEPGQKVSEEITINYDDSSQGSDFIELKVRISKKDPLKTDPVENELTLYFYGPEYELWGYHIMHYHY